MTSSHTTSSHMTSSHTTCHMTPGHKTRLLLRSHFNLLKLYSASGPIWRVHARQTRVAPLAY